MIEVRTYKDIYPAIEELIDDLRCAGFDESATILSHRMHEVAWTTGSELWAELVRVLSDLEATENSRLSPPLAAQVRAILAKMRESFGAFTRTDWTCRRTIPNVPLTTTSIEWTSTSHRARAMG